MSAVLELLLSAAARNSHHRLALLALSRLEGETGGRWRDLFFSEHEALFEGAKAPDAVFKDFKNHVLHVRDGFWGGAVQSATAWRERLLDALRRQNWREAAYAAGVLSHYVVDPIHPFHTAQSEAENVIHRALEWSVSKDFATLRSVLEVELGGYPEVWAPEGPDWLGEALRTGAGFANRFYDELIDRYDFDAGRKDPPAGLDEGLRRIIAGLMGYAAGLLAHVLQRTCDEAGVEPPRVHLAPAVILATLKAPARAVARAVGDLQERRLVGGMHREYKRTGKVLKTLPEDDRAVRALYAAEVLHTPLSNLDCEWPKPIGRAHGAPPSLSGRAAAAAPAAPASGPLRFRLAGEMDIVDAPSIGPKTAVRFKAIGVARVRDLLSLDPAETAAKLDAGWISARLVRDWQAQAALACAVPELPGLAAQLLVGAGVRDAASLAAAEPAPLYTAVLRYAHSEEGKRCLRDRAAPGPEAVQTWIANAKAVAGEGGTDQAAA